MNRERSVGQTKENRLKIKNLCIIAGAGDLPVYALDEAVKRNIPFRVYVLDDTNEALIKSLESLKTDWQKISLGRFDEILKKLRADQITHAMIVGKVSKKNFLSSISFNMKTLAILKKAKNFNDASLFELVAAEFKKIHVEIIKQDAFLKALLCPPGIYSRRKPDKKELADIDFGMDFAKRIALLDIGQTAVVAGKTLLAVEAVEGTDEAIRRGGAYARKSPGVVCKAMRKNQDTRFDVPTVGLQTVETMRQNNCRVLAIEAGHTFVADREALVQKINEYKMVFVAVKL